MALDPAWFKTDWALRQMATFQPTTALRWRVPPETTTASAVLEQMWRLEPHGEIKWLPVETVVE